MLVPGQQRLTVFCLRLFWVPRPHPVFQVLWQVQVLSSVLDTLRIWITRWMVLLLGAPPRCDPTCGQRVGAVSLALGENTDEDKFSSAGAGGWRTVPSTPSARRCSLSPGAGIRRVCGRWGEPTFEGWIWCCAFCTACSGAVFVGGGLVSHPCVVHLVLCGLRRVLTVSICLSNSVNLTLHVPIASMSHCLRIRLVCPLVVAPHPQHTIHLHVTLVCMMQCV